MKRSYFFTTILLSALVTCGCSKQVGHAPEINSVSDISGHRVAVVTGTCYELQMSKRDDIKLTRFNSESDQAQALVLGQADVAVNDEVTFNAKMMKDLGFKMAFKGDESYPAAFGFRKSETELLGSFNQFLAEVKANGTLDSLEGVWLKGDGKYPDPLRIYPNKGTGEPIRIGTAGATAPISFRIQEDWFGIESELMYLFGEWLGRPVKLMSYAPTSVMMSLQTGDIDIMMGCVFVTEERKEVFNFSDVYHYYHPAYFVKDMDANAGGGLWESIKRGVRRNLIEEGRWRFITDGLWETVKITLLSILFGSLLGMGLCAMARSRRRALRKTASLYNDFMQGIPMLVLLLIMFYVVFAGTSLSSSFVAIVAFALNFAAGAGGVFRNALDSVPRGQTEAGLALGFTRLQTFFGIVLPQAVKLGLPMYKGQCVSLLKGTSIVGYIAVHDLTRASDLIRSRTFDAFLPLLVVTVIYFLLAALIGLILNLIFNKSRAI